MENEIERLKVTNRQLLEACQLVDRAWAGDGVEMSVAVDACLLAIGAAAVAGILTEGLEPALPA